MSQAVLIPPPEAGLPALPRHPGTVVPRLVADCGEQAGWRYVEFFTANIRHPNTRRAYARPWWVWLQANKIAAHGKRDGRATPH